MAEKCAREQNYYKPVPECFSRFYISHNQLSRGSRLSAADYCYYITIFF